jgi:hypothetical protein
MARRRLSDSASDFGASAGLTSAWIPSRISSVGLITILVFSAKAVEHLQVCSKIAPQLYRLPVDAMVLNNRGDLWSFRSK